jgi:hypothetical protein
VNDPVELGWVYRATGCDASDTTQVFECQDISGGPLPDERVFIEVRSVTSGAYYFFNSVLPGELIVMRSFNQSVTTLMDEDIRVIIHEGTSVGGRHLQEMVFSIACTGSGGLTLGKIFGALQFASYTGTNGDSTSSVELVNYQYQVLNSGNLSFNVTQVRLTVQGFLTIVTPESPVVGAGEGITDFVPTYISLASPGIIDASVEITGETGNGGECIGEAVDSVPIEDSNVCMINTDMVCQRSDETPCSTLTLFDDSSLTCEVRPTELGWIYQGTDCSATTTTQTFFCEDSNGGPPSFDQVFVEAMGTSTGAFYFFNSVVPGDLVIMNNPNVTALDDNVQVRIYEGASFDGALIQQMLITTRCVPGDDLTIGVYFGSLQMISYSTISGASVQGYEVVDYVYTVSNVGDVSFNLIELTSNVENQVTNILPNDTEFPVGRELTGSFERVIPLLTSEFYSASVTSVGQAGGTNCTASVTVDFSVF